MIEILLVEDDQLKAGRIRQTIDNVLGNDAQITTQTNYVDACKRLESKQYDLLILDLLLPRDNESQPEHQYGIDILSVLCGPNPRFQQPNTVIGITAHSDLTAEFTERFTDEGWHLLQYSHSSDDWRSRLSNVLEHISAAMANKNNYETDLLIITALAHCEQEQVLNLPISWDKSSKSGDGAICYEGELNTDRGSLSVITTSAAQMGMPASTALAMKMICKVRPKYIAMCGIAAGLKGNFGDIMIADQAWDYGSGKIRTGWFNTTLFDPAPEPIPLASHIRTQLAEFHTNKELLSDIRNKWNEKKPEAPLVSKIGPFASGAAVLENKKLIKRIKRGQRKLIAIEMEAYGIFMAAHLAPNPKPTPFIAKSICDFGDPKKNNLYQDYAAFTSASFIYEFAKEYL